jgi:hypothetical protein
MGDRLNTNRVSECRALLWAPPSAIAASGVALSLQAWIAPGWPQERIAQLVTGICLSLLAGIYTATTLVIRALRQRIRPIDDTWQDGYEVGRSRGYWEAREELRERMRPVLVPLHCPDCGGELRTHKPRRSG